MVRLVYDIQAKPSKFIRVRYGTWELLMREKRRLGLRSADEVIWYYVRRAGAD